MTQVKSVHSRGTKYKTQNIKQNYMKKNVQTDLYSEKFSLK